jgi:hypothetical protein
MNWRVNLSRKAARQIKAMPVRAQKSVALLLHEIEESGPVRGNWPNYGKLEGIRQRHHCHLKKGLPSYVAVWEVLERETKLVEVIYVGSHEKAPH